MSLQDREILVRNDDGASITYSGNWTTVASDAVDNVGFFGPAFSRTLHFTTTTGSFSFKFNGSSIGVFGTICPPTTWPPANLSALTWSCYLDGILMPPQNPEAYENNYAFCNQTSISDTAHEIVVNITSSEEVKFYLDTIQYRPSPNVSLENSLIVINNNDSGINYISGWSAVTTETANQTTDPNGLINVTFIGTQLSWYGVFSRDGPLNASSGEYSVDDQPYTPFEIALDPAKSPNFTTVSNQLFFMTEDLMMGSHTLSARYTGSPGQAPLTLEYLIVKNGSFLSTFLSSTNHSSSVSGSSHASHAGSIIGSVVGVIGGIIVCTILFFWLRSRKRSNGNRAKLRSVIEPYPAQPHFISRTASLSPSKQTAEQNTSHARDLSQSSNSASISTDPNIPFPPHTIEETSTGPLRVSASPTQLIQSSPERPASVGRITTILPVQHEDSGVRLSQPAIPDNLIAADVPPTYSEQ